MLLSHLHVYFHHVTDCGWKGVLNIILNSSPGNCTFLLVIRTNAVINASCLGIAWTSNHLHIVMTWRALQSPVFTETFPDLWHIWSIWLIFNSWNTPIYYSTLFENTQYISDSYFCSCWFILKIKSSSSFVWVTQRFNIACFQHFIWHCVFALCVFHILLNYIDLSCTTSGCCRNAVLCRHSKILTAINLLILI